MSEIINVAGFHPPLTLPDHSMLIGTYNTSIFELIKTENLQKEPNFQNFHNTQIPNKKPKKDLKKINNLFFMSDEIRLQVESTILKLENILQNQDHLNNLWADIKNLLLKELDSLPDLPKSINKNQNKIF